MQNLTSRLWTSKNMYLRKFLTLKCAFLLNLLVLFRVSCALKKYAEKYCGMKNSWNIWFFVQHTLSQRRFNWWQTSKKTTYVISFDNLLLVSKLVSLCFFLWIAVVEVKKMNEQLLLLPHPQPTLEVCICHSVIWLQYHHTTCNENDILPSKSYIISYCSIVPLISCENANCSP